MRDIEVCFFTDISGKKEHEFESYEEALFELDCSTEITCIDVISVEDSKVWRFCSPDFISFDSSTDKILNSSTIEKIKNYCEGIGTLD